LVKVPEVPVMVTVAVPVVAVLLAVSVIVLVVVAGFALKMAVTPLGRPDADKVTPPLKPFWGATVIVLVRLVPCVMLRLPGDAARLKFGGAITVSVIVVVLIKLPEVPVIVTVAVPVVAVLLAVSVIVLVVVAGFALKMAVTPLGRPDADKVTPPLKPFWGATVIVLVPFAPCVTLRLLGDPERVKLPTEFRVRAIVVVFVRVPEVPVMVTVTVPIVAALLAVSVNMLAVLAGFGLNDAVTPLGRPDTDKVMLPLNPF
jgi:hypothetical protein